jgi:hypothetical protein
MAPDDLFSRDEVLGGLPARRAAATLFSIESRAAWLAHQSAQALDVLLSEDAARTRDLAFLEAFSAGREPPVAPTIEALERFAPHLAALVPPGAPVRAAVAHMLGAKYRFTRNAIPELRRALGLDEPAVAEAFRRQYRAEIESIYASRMSAVARVRLVWHGLAARIDALPPFWLTFLLTLAFSFSQAFLALPTGISAIGAVPGIAVVAAVGLVNVVTMACMAEACARSGDFRYGKAFLARLVGGYLGPEAALVFSLITALRTVLVMLAGSLGIALTLAASTGVRAEIWVAVVAVAELSYLSRRSQNVTITTMLTLLGVNLGLVGLITGLALARLELASLVAGPAVESGALKLALGVIAMLYIGHVYVVQCAKIVLPRDPSARALIRGSIAGTLTLVALFAGWIVAVNGVVPAARLAREAGTALPALAEHTGPSVLMLGAVLVTSLLGMSCLRTTTVMFNLVQERLPTRLQITVSLPRRRGDLVFATRGTIGDRVHLGVRYLGLDGGVPQLRIDVQSGAHIRRTDVTLGGTWDAATLLTAVPVSRRVGTASLVLETLDAHPDVLHVRVTTTMTLTAGGAWSPGDGHLLDVAGLDSPLRETAAWLLRRGDGTASDLAGARGESEGAARTALDTLVRLGYAERVAGAQPAYRARLGSRRPRAMPSDRWGTPAGTRGTAPAPSQRAPSALRLAAWRVVSSERGRLLASSSPVLLVFLIAEAMLLTASGSFAGVLGFGGVIANSMTAGIFPVLLLVSSRRKGECVPGVVYTWLGHPFVTVGVYALALAMLFAHGAAIYREPSIRATALLAGLAVLAVTARAFHRGAFTRRTVVELRANARDGSAVLNLMSGGQPLAAEIVVARPEGDERHHAPSAAIAKLAGVSHVTVTLPRSTARDVKVWTHRVTPERVTEGLPATVEVEDGRSTRRVGLTLSEGQAILPIDGAASTVRIVLASDEEA